jgi:hypothetical protein
MADLKLSISIMAHPKRKDFIPYLQEKLGKCPVSFDEGFGLWENAKHAWKMYDPKADYHLVIQDDAIICDNFMERASETIRQSEALFKNRPHLINFYYDALLTPSNAKEIIKQKYIIRSKICWAVAICVPTSLINEMIAFCDSLNIPQDDEKITAFMRSKKLKCYFPIPSLIDHRTEENSLIGNIGQRKAWRYVE